MMSFTIAALLRPILFFWFLFACMLPISCYAAHHSRTVDHHHLTHRKRKLRQHKSTHQHTAPHHHTLPVSTHHQHADKHPINTTHQEHHRHKPIDKIRLAKQLVVRKATKQLGKPYVYGGSSPRTGFDCSGLVYFIYAEMFTPYLPRTANNMFHMHSASSVHRKQLETGDLVFFHIHSQQHSHADHVGIYLGHDRFIQAPHTGSHIRISNLNNNYWRKHYLGARRLLEIAKISLPQQLY